MYQWLLLETNELTPLGPVKQHTHDAMRIVETLIGFPSWKPKDKWAAHNQNLVGWLLKTMLMETLIGCLYSLSVERLDLLLEELGNPYCLPIRTVCGMAWPPAGRTCKPLLAAHTHCLWNGLTSCWKNLRAVARYRSWSSLNRVRVPMSIKLSAWLVGGRRLKNTQR